MLNFDSRLNEICQPVNGNFSVYVETMDGESYGFNDDRIIPSASLIKIPVLLRLFLDAEEGKISLGDKIVLNERNRVGGTGLIDMFPPENEFSFELLGTLMIVLSDNCAANQLIDTLGMDRIQSLISSLGMNETKLQRKMMDFDAIAAGRNNYTSARDMGRLAASMAHGKYGEAGKKVIDVMKRQIIRDMIPMLIPSVDNDKSCLEIDVPEKGSVLVANKTGNLSDKLHDVAWCRMHNGKEYVIAVMSDKLESLPEGRGAIAKISKAVFEELSNSAVF